jgi:hypothetical protein
MNTAFNSMKSSPFLALARSLFSVGLLLALPLAGSAATSSWIGTAASPNFTNTTYWAGGVVPGVSDTALFTNVLTGNIGILWTIPVENSVVSFDYRNSASYNAINLTNTDWAVTSRLAIEPSVAARTNFVRLRNGTLTVTNASRTAVMEVGSGLGRAGFDLAGGTLNVDSFVVTNVGAGLNILNGGALVGGTLNTFASSVIILTNGGINPNLELKNGAAWNMLGGSNLVRIATGGRSFLVESASVFRVSGVGTFLDSSAIGVGYAWYDRGGAFWVQDGATAQLTSLSVGTNASNFSGSGVNGRGSVIVSNGGVLLANQISTGLLGFGTVSVSSATLQFTTNTPFVETKTVGTIVLSGGTLSFLGASNAAINGQITNIAYSGANTLQLNNATNAVLSSYAFSNGAAFSTLDLAGTASLWRSTNLVLGAGGKIAGSGRVQANLVTSSGTLAPGHSPGALSFSSNLTLLGGSEIVLEIGGTNAGAYDQVLVDGVLARAGTLTVTNLGWTFAGGDQFNLFDFGAWSGAFSATNLPTLSGGLSWDFTQFESSGVLGVVSAIPEPSVLAAAAAGLALFGWFRRRSRG